MSNTIALTARPGRAHRGQAGFTLLEAVVSLGLVSTVILALAAGLLTSVNSSRAARETQEIDTALSAYAEGFKLSDNGCAVPGATTVDGFTASVTTIESWDGSSWVACDVSVAPHRLTVRLDGAGSSTVEGQVVVGDSP